MLLDVDHRIRRERPRQGPLRRHRLAAMALGGLLLAYGIWGATLPSGEVHVISDPAGATVVIDDWFRGETPSSHRLPFGTHKVVVSANSRAKKSFRVTVGHQPVLIEARLDPLRAPWKRVGEQ